MSSTEIFKVASDRELSESGGGHNQKGTNFQRVWAVARMFELEDEGKDFLLLFESIQDVAVFDAEKSPTLVSIYQVKKKDSSNWKWNELTGLLALTTKKADAQPLTVVKGSPLGKLYASVMAFKEIKSIGCFISNMGCDLPLLVGGNAATTTGCDLSKLDAKHVARLSAALATLHETAGMSPELHRVRVEKVAIHPDAPETALVGIAHTFLAARSPHHANQARTLVDALLAKVGPLGAKTDACQTFEDLRRQRGYSREQFREALATLERIPDIESIVSDWLHSWPSDAAFNFVERTRVKLEVARIYQARLAGPIDPTDVGLVAAIDTWLEEHPLSSDPASALQMARGSLASKFPEARTETFTAHFLMRAAKLCADQISSS